MVKMQLYRLQTTVLLQWVMGDVWYQDNLEYLSDSLTPYPLHFIAFLAFIFFLLSEKV